MGYIGTQNGIVKAPGLKGRGAAQNARYREGVQSGELNHAERAVLRQTRRNDRAALADAKASGGTVNFRERAALHADMRQSAVLLAAFKHN